jgi:Uncharacterized protein containing a von Willebrand factor type A (vWA) domain
MKDNRYSRAISKIEPKENFEAATLAKMEAARGEPKPRIRRFVLSGAALVACALALAIALPRFLPVRNGTLNMPLPEPDTTAQTAVVQATPGVKTAADDEAPTGETEWFVVTEEADGMYAMEAMPAMGMYSNKGFSFSFNTEEYSQIVESGFKSVLTSPLSTFAADVDTAGYTTVRRKLLNGEMPARQSVRIEEMLNYFSYRGLAPEDDKPVAISTALDVCPWNENAALLMVGVGAQKIATDDLPRSNIVFLVDTSGSMDGPDRLDLIKRAFALFTENLREGDVISIVTYAGTDRVELEGVDGARRSEIMDKVNAMTAWGSTNGSAGIVTAYAIAEKYFIQGGNNRVILMTDGDLNVGVTSQAALTELIEEKKQSGVFLSVMGFGGWNYKDNKLEALADHGNGVYSYIDSLEEARRALVTEMGANFFTVAKDVKLQVEFNPAYVSAYRLIGYENRALANEDFADDTKDGGEMGSGHTVVALYELIPAEGTVLAGVKGSQGAQASELKYQTAQTTGIEEVAQVKVRCKLPDGEKSEEYVAVVTPDAEASEDMQRNLRLAEAVTEFGMLLRNSQYKGASSYDMAVETLKKLDGANDDETELMYLISRAKGLENWDGGIYVGSFSYDEVLSYAWSVYGDPCVRFDDFLNPGTERIDSAEKAVTAARTEVAGEREASVSRDASSGMWEVTFGPAEEGADGGTVSVYLNDSGKTELIVIGE